MATRERRASDATGAPPVESLKNPATQKHTANASLEGPGTGDGRQFARSASYGRGEKIGELTLVRDSLYWYGR